MLSTSTCLFNWRCIFGEMPLSIHILIGWFPLLNFNSSFYNYIVSDTWATMLSSVLLIFLFYVTGQNKNSIVIQSSLFFPLMDHIWCLRTLPCLSPGDFLVSPPLSWKFCNFSGINVGNTTSADMLSHLVRERSSPAPSICLFGGTLRLNFRSLKAIWCCPSFG